MDYIVEAKVIINELDADGFHEHAERIKTAISSGSVGTEIVMAIRWNLQEIERDKIRLKKKTKEKIEKLINELNSILQ